VNGLTYRDVGATRRDDLMSRPPAGFRPLERVVRLGEGDPLWEWAVAETLALGIQRRSGLRPVRRDPSVPVGVGERAILRLGPLRIPIEVVDVVEEPQRRGFAYGTLRGHPESGEEAFLIERRDDGSVWLRIRAFSRPAHPLLWIGYPVLRVFQEVYTRRYERALTRRS
jgi:uncharacterized protein (UPF0548 family)